MSQWQMHVAGFVRFEDKLRARANVIAGIRLNVEERDALADAIEAMRDVSAFSVLQHYGPYLVQEDVMEKLNRALARLDANA